MSEGSGRMGAGQEMEFKPSSDASVEREIIKMLVARGKTVRDSANFLRMVIHVIEQPIYANAEKAFDKPLSDSMKEPK